MSKNAANKRRAKARHRWEFSRGYIDADYLTHMICQIPPQETPLLRYIKARMNG